VSRTACQTPSLVVGHTDFGEDSRPASACCVDTADGSAERRGKPAKLTAAAANVEHACTGPIVVASTTA
jgi:hypothetical protein